MTPDITVVLPTHNPHPGRFARTLDGLRRQTLPASRWELVVVDNGSAPAVEPDLAWHPAGRVVREPRLGLTRARVAGGAAAAGAVLVFVDDDNVLAPDYLERVVESFAAHPRLGAAGGKSVPEWERRPEPWVDEFGGNLALRDLGETEVVEGGTGGYPRCGPIGAGMAVRRAAWGVYADGVAGGRVAVTDRRGGELTSGGDNDIVLHVVRGGWQVGYFPRLALTHLIPAGRTTRSYLARLNRGIAKSWVQVLHRHGIRPWPPVAGWTVPLRKWRAYLRHRAWAGPAEYVRWQGVCGQFEGRAAIAGGPA